MLTRSSLTIRLHPNDDVVIARAQLVGGTQLLDEKITISGLVPPGHKVATRAIKAGEPVRRYNQIIGFASRDIAPGEHVHLQQPRDGRRSSATTRSAPTRSPRRTSIAAGDVRRHRARGRPNAGRVATRNYIGILSTVNCSATVARGIADHFTRERLAEFPQRRRRGRADARLGLRHGHARRGHEDPAPHARRLRAPSELRGRADDRPRLRGEPDQLAARRREARARARCCRRSASRTPAAPRRRSRTASGSIRGDAAARQPGDARSRCPRRTSPSGLQCGGSDGYSGITANPALGAAVDLLVRHGGTAILSETPEIYGAEHLLTRRAVSREVGEKLIARIKLVGGLHGARARRDEQQPVARQQGGRARRPSSRSRSARSPRAARPISSRSTNTRSR